MVLLLKNTQVFEGFVGGLATVFVFLFKKKFMKVDTNGALLAGLCWMLVWYLRKIFQNMYGTTSYAKERGGVDIEDTYALHIMAAACAALIGYAFFEGLTTEIGKLPTVMPWALMAVIGGRKRQRAFQMKGLGDTRGKMKCDTG